MSQTQAKPLTWEDYANNVFPYLEPKVKELLKKQLPMMEESKDWGRALGVLNSVLKQLQDLTKFVEQANKGEVPPSKAVQNLLDRLTTLEENYAVLRTDVEMMIHQ